HSGPPSAPVAAPVLSGGYRADVDHRPEASRPTDQRPSSDHYRSDSRLPPPNVRHETTRPSAPAAPTTPTEPVAAKVESIEDFNSMWENLGEDDLVDYGDCISLSVATAAKESAATALPSAPSTSSSQQAFVPYGGGSS